MPRLRLFRRDSWEFGHESAAEEQPLAEPRKRRTATTVAYAALFFAGAGRRSGREQRNGASSSDSELRPGRFAAGERIFVRAFRPLRAGSEG